jgi:YD repeat-containing protein
LNAVFAGLFLIACSSQPKPTAVTNQSTATGPPIVHVAACPFSVVTPFDHELFAGCAPPPFTQSFGVCGHHACSQPCKIQSGAETVAVTYDHGRFAEAKHVDGSKKDNLDDIACTYDGDRMKTCTHSFYGALAATRDPSGDLAKLLEAEQPDQPRVFTYDTHHRVASYAEFHESFDATYGEADRLERLAWHYKGKDSTSTFRYDSDGDVVESIDSEEGMRTTYEYGPNKLLRHVVTTTGHDNPNVDTLLEYDPKDRLVRQTLTDPSRSPQSVFVTTYAYCD